MKHNCYHVRQCGIPSTCLKVQVLSSEQQLLDGRVVSRSVFVMDDPETRLVGFKMQDFYLENMVAQGVDLKECKMDSSSFVASASIDYDALKNTLKLNLDE